MSVNYHGRVRVTGPGIKIEAKQPDWSTCKLELKIKAVKLGCDIGVNVSREESDAAIIAYGIAYSNADRTQIIHV